MERNKYKNMETTPVNNEYLLILRNTEWGHDMPVHEAQAALESMLHWVEALNQEGIFVAGQPLGPDGAVVSGSTAEITDGPFAESKEIVGGYIVVRASSLDGALKAAKRCPVLKFGVTVEVRPLLQNCPLADEVGVQMLVTAQH